MIWKGRFWGWEGEILESLREDVLGRRLSNGNQAFFRLICIDATKYVLLSFSTLLEPICPKNWAKTCKKSTSGWLAVKRACEDRAPRARKTLTPRFSDSWFWEKTDCFAVYWLTGVAQKHLCLKGPCQEDIAVLWQFCDEVITAAYRTLPLAMPTFCPKWEVSVNNGLAEG